jgi:hypothetical protein
MKAIYLVQNIKNTESFNHLTMVADTLILYVIDDGEFYLNGITIFRDEWENQGGE